MKRIEFGFTEERYNQEAGIRRSALWKIARSPQHFKYELEHPSEKTQALMFGAAAHTAVLLPATFKEMYAVAQFDGRTKDGKAERQAAQEKGITLLTAEQMAAIDGIVDAVNGNPYARRLLEGPHEVSYFWDDDITGEQCKCRTDCETDIDGQHYIVDLKTCADASTDAFMRDAIKYGYFMQAAMYSVGVKAVTGKDSTFVFLCVEKEAPYAINIIPCGEKEITLGMDGDKYGKAKGFRELIGIYHQCIETGTWPGPMGFGGEPSEFRLPKWLAEEE